MKQNRQLLLCGSISALLLLLIWGNSLQPATASDALSTGILAQLQQVWLNVTGNAFPLSNHLLRKIAHFSEFFLLGLFTTYTGITYSKKIRRFLPAVLYVGLLSAVIDEAIQYFSPGRSPQVTDVLIDHSGFCCGLLLALFLWKWRTAMYKGLSN